MEWKHAGFLIKKKILGAAEIQVCHADSFLGNERTLYIYIYVYIYIYIYDNISVATHSFKFLQILAR